MQIAEPEEGVSVAAGSGALESVLAEVVWNWSSMGGNGAGKASELDCCKFLGWENDGGK